MSETAARQSDRVLLNAVSRVFFEEVRAWLRASAGAVPGARVGAAAVTFVQRFGGSLNLNPHLHMLVADGMFACREDGSTPTLVSTAAPTRDGLRGVIARVIARLETIAARRAKRSQVEDDGMGDDGMEGLRRTAGGRGTFARVDERGAHEGDDEERRSAPLQLASRRLVAEMDGFNLHAGVRWRGTTVTGSSGCAAIWRGLRWRRGACRACRMATWPIG